MTGRPLPAWKRRRFERLGIPIPEERREPSQRVPEHSASAATLRTIAELERQADRFS